LVNDALFDLCLAAKDGKLAAVETRDDF